MRRWAHIRSANDDVDDDRKRRRPTRGGRFPGEECRPAFECSSAHGARACAVFAASPAARARALPTGPPGFSSYPAFSAAKKILEHQRNKERKAEEKLLRERKERIQRAQEERRKAQEEQDKRDKVP
uniref:Uncharacterized protein n=1 Tax=Plectus sambesii TaxID=2011161 RepID=A0A914XG13_9BILA